MQHTNVNSKVRLMVKMAVMMGLIALATAFIQIPTGLGGNVNGGDAMIFAAVAVLGYWSIPAAALGSAMVDLLSPFAIYTPATLLIKGGMALICAFFLRNEKKDSFVRRILVFACAEVVMLLGYFLYEGLIMNWQSAVGGLLFNLIQAAFGIVAGSLLFPIFRRFNDQIIEK